MTVTTATYPPGRYGRRRDPRRRRQRRAALIALLGVVVAAALAITWRLYHQYATGYDVTVLGLSQVTDHQITIRFKVHQPTGAGSTCRVQAQDYRHTEVGYAEVAVPPGQDVTVSYTLHTTSRPYSADVLGCAPARSR